MKAACALIAGASLVACVGAAPRSVRPDEPAARLEDLAPLRDAFNRHPERTRIVALASPS